MHSRNRCDVNFVSRFVESVASNLWSKLADRSIFMIFEHWLMWIYDDVRLFLCLWWFLCLWSMISWNSLSSINALVLVYLCYAFLLLARSISFLLFYRWFRHSRTRSTIFKNVFSIPLSIFRISRISSINRSTCASTLLILRHHFHRIAKII